MPRSGGTAADADTSSAVPRSGGAQELGTAPGSQASNTWKLSGGLRNIVQGLPDETILPSGGANSGVSRAMLLAGGTSQADVTKSEVFNSNDPDHWMKLGDKRYADVNDGDLNAWFEHHEIPVIFAARFWPNDRVDMKGYVVAMLRRTNLPPEADIIIEEPSKRNPLKVKWRRTEVLISRDPTVDGSEEINYNCLRDAIEDTYPNAKNQTLQQLKEESKKFNGPLGSMPDYLPRAPRVPQKEETEAPSDQDSSASKDDKSKEEPRRSSRAKRKAAPKSKADEQPAQPAKRGNTKGLGKTHVASAAIYSIARGAAGLLAFACGAILGQTATSIASKEDKHQVFGLRDNTPGATVCALYATTTVCMMAESLGYTAAFLPPEPRNQRDAQRRPDRDKWHTAEQEELDMLWKMGTFELVDKPSNYDPLPLQFVYKLKVKDGDFDKCRYKARLVMRGNLQYEHEYGDTYAPTARLWVVRTLAAIAAQEGLVMKKFDLTGAFLVADMDRELYVNIPGYEVPDGKAIRLRKALYGGKSSGALYAKEIRSFLEGIGFRACSVDETLFKLTRTTGGKTSTLLVSLYVDDGACCTNDEALYQEFLTALKDKYDLSDSGDLDWHLGIKFTQDPDNGTISLDQTAYIDAILKRFGMEDCKDKHTPLEPGVHLSAEDCPANPDKKDVRTYQQLIGSLMYVACGTRPDIAFAVSACSQYMQAPGPSHFKAAKHILRYLRTTKHEKITYRRQSNGMANRLYGFVDADHAGSHDDRKSVGGYVLMLNGGAISWSSRKIKVVAISSFESEWYSASICGCEIVVVRRLLEEIGRKQDDPTALFEDNAACVYTATNFSKPMAPRSKHIDTRIFKLREFVEEGVLTLLKVDSSSNIADCLTKALPRDAVEMARDYMFGVGITEG